MQLGEQPIKTGHIQFLTVIAGCGAAAPGFAGIASTMPVVQNISSQVGTPAGLQTWGVYVAFTHPEDYLISTSDWHFTIDGGTFFNADPVADDPFDLVPDDGGHVPLPSAFLAFMPVWAYDSNLSIDDSPSSIAEPGTVMTSTLIGPGGAAIDSPPTAGADLLIQVAQFTFSAGTPIVLGSFGVVTPGPDGEPDCTYITASGPLGDSDLNFDHRVNGIDLGILLAHWSIPAGSPACDGAACCRPDINSDGVVDGLDLGILLTDWDAFP